jgi:hypothetical protein
MNKIFCGSILHDVGCLGHALILFIDDNLLGGIPVG